MKTDGKPFQVKTKRPTRENTVPRMPHERDESEDSQSSGPRDDMKQAYLDITNGQVDTDLRGVRGVDTVEQAKKKPLEQSRPPADRKAGTPGSKVPKKNTGTA
jgi:hypothetical protein